MHLKNAFKSSDTSRFGQVSFSAIRGDPERDDVYDQNKRVGFRFIPGPRLSHVYFTILQLFIPRVFCVDRYSINYKLLTIIWTFKPING